MYNLCEDNANVDEFNNGGLGRVFYENENVTVEFCSTSRNAVCRLHCFFLQGRVHWDTLSSM